MAVVKAMAACPDCGRKIELRPQSEVGDEVICPYCDAELELVSMNPPELDWAYLEPAEDGDDDWDDDWDDEDD